MSGLKQSISYPIYIRWCIIILIFGLSTGCALTREHVVFHSFTKDEPEISVSVTVQSSKIQSMIEQGYELLGVIEIENDLKTCRGQNCKTHKTDLNVDDIVTRNAELYSADIATHVETHASKRRFPYSGKCTRSQLKPEGGFKCVQRERKYGTAYTKITRALLWRKHSSAKVAPNSEQAVYIVRTMYNNADKDFTDRCKALSPSKYNEIARREATRPLGSAIFFAWDMVFIRVPVFTAGTIIGTSDYLTSVGEDEKQNPQLGLDWALSLPLLKAKPTNTNNYCYGAKYFATILNKEINTNDPS